MTKATKSTILGLFSAVMISLLGACSKPAAVKPENSAVKSQMWFGPTGVIPSLFGAGGVLLDMHIGGMGNGGAIEYQFALAGRWTGTVTTTSDGRISYEVFNSRGNRIAWHVYIPAKRDTPPVDEFTTTDEFDAGVTEYSTPPIVNAPQSEDM